MAEDGIHDPSIATEADVEVEDKDKESTTSDLGEQSGDTPDYRGEIHAFYEEHNPEKIDQVDRILEQWNGKEDIMLVALHEKYNKALPPGLKTRLQASTPVKPEPGPSSRSISQPPRTTHTARLSAGIASSPRRQLLRSNTNNHLQMTPDGLRQMRREDKTENEILRATIKSQGQELRRMRGELKIAYETITKFKNGATQ